MNITFSQKEQDRIAATMIPIDRFTERAEAEVLALIELAENTKDDPAVFTGKNPDVRHGGFFKPEV